MINVLFFARVRDEAGTDKMFLPLPEGVTCVSELTVKLKQESEALAQALSMPNVLVAVNQEMVQPDAVIQDGDEIAYFPPVTGG